jgi:tetratricopeptide (TPR) repeat protein
MFARALAIRERTLPADHPSIASTLGNLAQLEYEQGRHREAAAHFERALTIRASRGAAPKDRAFESFGLARALWALGDRNRARQLAEEARTTYVDAGEGYRDRHDEVVQWLAKRR